MAHDNETVEMHGIDLVRLRDGRIAERWGYGNFAELMLHLEIGKRGPHEAGAPPGGIGTLPAEEAGEAAEPR